MLKNKKKPNRYNKKINTVFKEVVQLAKENDPSFLARFGEVYPELLTNSKKIISKYLILLLLVYNLL